MPAMRALRVDVVRVLRAVEDVSTRIDRPRVWMERLEPRVLFDGAGADAFSFWVHDVTPDYDEGSALAVGADGAVYAGGSTIEMRGFVARYLPDGTPDPAFGTNGVADIDSGEPGDSVMALAAQADGKVVVAGWSRTVDEATGLGEHRHFRLRLNADGTPDRTYAGGGENGDGVARDWEVNRFGGVRMFALADGDVLMIGSASRDNPDVALGRFNADGLPDASFGDAGIAMIDLGGEERVLHASITADGKVMITGGSSNHADNVHRVMVMRVLPTGAPDPTFADGGVLWSTEGAYVDVATDAAGRTFSLGSRTVWCFAPDGTPDTSFGDGGALRFGDDFSPFSLLVTKSGGVVVGGQQYVPELGTSDGTAWYGFTPDGAPDPAFGDAGRVRVESGRMGFYYEHVFAPDGSVIHVGAQSLVSDFGSAYAFVRIGPQLTGGFLHWNDVPGGSDQAAAPKPKPEPTPTPTPTPEPEDPTPVEELPPPPAHPPLEVAPAARQSLFGSASPFSRGGIMDVLDPDAADDDDADDELAPV